MKKIFLIILFIINYITIHSQNFPIKIYGNISPLCIFETRHNYARGGIGLIFKNQISLSFDYGYGSNFGYWKFSDKYLFRAYRPEIKVFFFDKNLKETIYIGIEYYYSKMKYNFDGYFSYKDNLYLAESSVFYKDKEGLNLKIGTFYNFSKHIFIDLYGGIGYYRKLNYIFSQSLECIDPHSINRLFFPKYLGFSSGIQPVGGIKIGVMF